MVQRNLKAQTIIYLEDFTGYPNQTTQNTPNWSTNALDIDDCGLNCGSNYWGTYNGRFRCNDIEGPGNNGGNYFTTRYFNISAFTNVVIKVDYQAGGGIDCNCGSNCRDYLVFEYSLNGGPWTQFQTNGNVCIDPAIPLDSAITSCIGGDSVAVRIQLGNMSNSENSYIDNIRILGFNSSFTTTNDTTLCNTGSGSVQLQLIASGGFNYNWSGGNLSCTGCANPVAILTQTDSFFVSAFNALGCTITDTVIVTINPLPTATAASSSPICVGNAVNLTASGGSSYSWSGPNGFISNQQNPTINPATTNATGTYTVTVTDNNGCTNTATVNVTVNQAPTPTAASNSPICEGAALNLTSTGGGTYSWTGPNGFTSNQQNPTINQATPAAFGTYTVTVYNGCTATALVNVTVNSQPNANFGMSSDKVNLYDATISFTNLSNNGQSYIWNFGDGDTSTQFNTHHTYGDTGLYCVTLEVLGSNGCNADTIKCLRVISDYFFYIPGAFTPNGDGLNDIFKVYGENIVRVKMMIFNRWGEKIYYSNNGTPWNGFENNYGKNSPIGVYVYKIQLRDLEGNLHKFIGRVSLVR